MFRLFLFALTQINAITLTLFIISSGTFEAIFEIKMIANYKFPDLLLVFRMSCYSPARVAV